MFKRFDFVDNPPSTGLWNIVMILKNCKCSLNVLFFSCVWYSHCVASVLNISSLLKFPLFVLADNLSDNV